MSADVCLRSSAASRVTALLFSNTLGAADSASMSASLASFPFQHTLHELDQVCAEILCPIDVWINLDGEDYLVYDEKGMSYGLGSSILTAIGDYQKSLVIDMQLLLKDRGALAPSLERRLRCLETHIRLLEG
ncbi:MAG: hypothetical protein ACYC4R_05260 [Anaerolineae bacterium]